MDATADGRTPSDASRDWFRDWFGEEYLAIYPHRDEREAEEAVRLFLAAAPPPPVAGVLDVACGAGRHLRELLAAGVPAVGLDLSRELLRRARGASPRARVVRADMRSLPFADGAFAGVTSFFTSFGYFESRDEDARVVAEMRRVLRPGGSFMLDFLNADRVRADLVASDEFEVRGHRVVQTRWIDGDVVTKRIRIEESARTGARGARTFEERVRLYEAGDLDSILSAAGLSADARFGDYAGGPFGPASPRLILAGHAR